MGLKVSLGTLTEKNVKLLKTLNAVCFPVSYQDSVYTEILTHPDYARLAYFNDVMVGGVACRVEKREKRDDKLEGKRLYIMTLCVLDKYRRHGIASQLVQYVLDKVKEDTDIEAVYLNVQTSNTAAQTFYESFGFKNVKTQENFYRNIDPPHAFVFFKPLHEDATFE